MDYDLRKFDHLDSSNAECQRIVGGGYRGNLWVTTKTQSSGRGRRGREWVSEPGNLFASLLYEIDCDVKTASQLSFVAALAVRDAAADMLQSDAAVTCKWPNDILVAGKKVAGILLETAGGSAPSHVIIGIGVNMRSHPEKAQYPATHMGPEFEVDNLMDRLISSMSHWIGLWKSHGFSHIRTAWLDNATGRGQQIIVRLAHEELRGIFCDLDESGALILEFQGKRRHITAGDVFFV